MSSKRHTKSGSVGGRDVSMFEDMFKHVDSASIAQNVSNGQAEIGKRLVGGDASEKERSQARNGKSSQRQEQPRRVSDSRSSIKKKRTSGKQFDRPARGDDYRGNQCDNNGCPPSYRPCGPNPITDVIPVPQKEVQRAQVVMGGFVASVLNISTIDELPYVINEADASGISLVPNPALPNNTMLSMLTMLGLGIPMSNAFPGQIRNLPAIVVLSQQPGEYGVFNGLYAATFCEATSLRLLRFDWASDACAPDVGTYIWIFYGATAGLYSVTDIDERCQTVSLESTGVSDIEESRVMEMTSGCSEEHKYWQVPVATTEPSCYPIINPTAV